MAMTATIALDDSTVVTEQACTAILTISNSASAPVNMTAIVPYVLPTGGGNSLINTGVSIDAPNFGPSTITAVQGSGTLVITWQMRFHAPSNSLLGNGPGTTFDVGATCYSDDGSVFKPNVTTVTVSYAVTYPTAQQ